jgi:inosine-uridine nucleoside N-ribohydrolase
VTRRKIILDTDPGVGVPGSDADDPLALLLALGDPRLELLAVTTVFGNTPPVLGARGAAAVLAAAGRTDIPIAVGMAERLDGTLHPVLTHAYAGARGRVGSILLPSAADAIVDEHAVDLIIRTARESPGEITLVAIGPQTNIATALLREPRLSQWLDSIVFMGGGLGLQPTYGRGNITPVAECNIHFDAPAAEIVFRSGIPLTMVGLDVTNPATGMVLSSAAIAGVDPARSPVAGLFRAVCQTYLDAPMFDWTDGCVLYDPLAVAVAADPGLGTYTDMALVVETLGQHTLGQTVPAPHAHPNIRVMTDVDGPALVPSMLTTILAAGGTR